MTFIAKIYRLATGIAMLYLVFYIHDINPYIMLQYERNLQVWFTEFAGEIFGELLYILTSLAFYVTLASIGLVGLFRIITFNRIPDFAANYDFVADISKIMNLSFFGTYQRNQNTECRNIERMKQYRDAKIGGLVQKEASEEYLKTAALDALHSGNNTRQTKRALRYIDSALGGKSYEEGYNWLKDKDSFG